VCVCPCECVSKYTHTRTHTHKHRTSVAGDLGAQGPKFYLPTESWPCTGPCLFCFSVEHATTAHAKREKLTLVGERVPTLEKAGGGGVLKAGGNEVLDCGLLLESGKGDVEPEVPETDEGSQVSHVDSVSSLSLRVCLREGGRGREGGGGGGGG